MRQRSHVQKIVIVRSANFSGNRGSQRVGRNQSRKIAHLLKEHLQDQPVRLWWAENSNDARDTARYLFDELNVVFGKAVKRLNIRSASGKLFKRLKRRFLTVKRGETLVMVVDNEVATYLPLWLIDTDHVDLKQGHAIEFDYKERIVTNTFTPVLGGLEFFFVLTYGL